MNSKEIYWRTINGERVCVADMSDKHILHAMKMMRNHKLPEGDGWVDIFTEELKDRKIKNRNKIINNLLIDEEDIGLDLY